MTAVVIKTEPQPAEEPSPVAGDLPVEIEKRRHRRRMTAICLLAYAALALLAFLPTAPFATREFPAAGPGNPAGADPFQMTWFLAWFPYAVTHGLNIFQTTRFDYPSGVNLADNTSVPLLGLIAWPITATLGPVAAFNFLIRLAFALSGASMFLVLRRWCTSTIAPFVGGLLYAFGPYMAGQELHLDLTFVPIPPLLVLLADELVRRQRMKPVWLGILIGAATAGELLISPDVMSGCMVLALGAGLVLVIRHRHELREMWGYLWRAGAAAGVTLGLIAGYPIFEMIAGANHVSGPVIPIGALQALRADLLGPLAPTRNLLLVPHVIAHLGDELVISNLSENVTFLGLPLLILLVVIVRRLRGDTAIRAFSWLALSAFVISLGSRLTFATLQTVIPLPEGLFEHMPLLQNTIPARYGLYVALFASMIVAIGIDRLWIGQRTRVTIVGGAAAARWRARLGRLGGASPRARHARIGVVACLVTLSLLPRVPFGSRQIQWPGSLIPTIARVVPAGSVVVTYPYATPLHPEGMLWEALAGMDYHLMGGYANIEVDHAGQRWPPLLDPVFVQEKLAYSRMGDRWPAPGPVTAADLVGLRTFLNHYSVGAIVYWSGGGDPSGAYAYILDAVGRPTARTRQYAIWLPTKGHWLPPAIR
jgi:hypothetical protein